jgi:hypothetical protein
MQMFFVSLTEKIVSFPKAIWLFLLRKIFVVYSEKYIKKYIYLYGIVNVKSYVQ